MPRLRLMIGFVVLVCSGTAAAQSIRNAPRITIDELKPLLTSNAVLVLDVRSSEEFAEGHIPGAVNLDYTLIPARGIRFRDEPRPIVTYCACSNEMTAARAAVDLAALGISGAKALRGGWEEWKSRGEPFEK